MSEDGVEREDTELLTAHVGGDPHAFAELFTRHRDRLWAVALRTTGNPEDAADALQDALVSAHRRAGSFRGEAAVTTWLHRIVVNACLDRLRRARVRAADPLPDDLEEQAARGAVTVGPGSGTDPRTEPEAALLAGDRRDRVRAALAELAPEQRAALVLVDMEGYPVAEAAAILEVPTGTVKSRCARGRARLGVLLGDLRLDAPPDVEHPTSATDAAGPGTGSGPRASHPGGPAPPRRVPGTVASPAAPRPTTIATARAPGPRDAHTPDAPPHAAPDDQPETDRDTRPDDQPDTRPDDRPDHQPDTRPDDRPDTRSDDRPDIRAGAHPGAGREARDGQGPDQDRPPGTPAPAGGGEHP